MKNQQNTPQTTTDDSATFTVKEAADTVWVSISWIYKMIKQNELHPVNSKRPIRIRKDEFFDVFARLYDWP